VAAQARRYQAHSQDEGPQAATAREGRAARTHRPRRTRPVFVNVTIASDDRVGKFRYLEKKKLADPKKASRGANAATAGTRAGDRNYTATDREDVAFAIVQAYLAETAKLDLEDLRDQDNVGADAVDRAKDIWVELKTAGRDRDDTIKLERSEAMRAKDKGDRYWLVVVWNLEKPRTPQLLIVQNPLARLDTFLGSGIKLVGLDELASPG
jgi:hypothetical protein